MQPLGRDPQRIRGLSENLIVSHYENNYGGAVKRPNVIAEQLAGLDFAAAPGYLINGLKREELIAFSTMILHELFFASLGEGNAPDTVVMAAIHGQTVRRLLDEARRARASRAGDVTRSPPERARSRRVDRRPDRLGCPGRLFGGQRMCAPWHRPEPPLSAITNNEPSGF